jgi:hypothetical protein
MAKLIIDNLEDTQQSDPLEDVEDPHFRPAVTVKRDKNVDYFKYIAPTTDAEPLSRDDDSIDSFQNPIFKVSEVPKCVVSGASCFFSRY